MQYGATSNAAGFVPVPYHDDWTAKVCADGMFECPNPQCGNRLKVRISQTAKNPNRPFISCNKKYGCGEFFGFLDAPFKGFSGSNKRQRNEGNGAIASARMPDECHKAIVDMAQRLQRMERVLDDVYGRTSAQISPP